MTIAEQAAPEPEPGPDTLQRISYEMILQLRLLKKDMNVSTGRVSAAVMEAIRAELKGDRKRTEERLNYLETLFGDLSLRWTTSINGLSSFFTETGKSLRNRKDSKPSEKK
jgi:hypothetical protein